MKKRWTIEEKEYLKSHYSDYPKTNLLTLLNNRSWDAIKLKANKLGLIRDIDISYRRLRNGDASVLTQETVEAYYWMGFLLADGHFTNNRILISLAIKDHKHLEKLAKLLNTSITCNQIYAKLAIAHAEVVLILRNKFHISNRKTYDPCKLSRISDEDLLFALVIGFIDGDGSIGKLHNRNDVALRIKCHSEWFENLNIMAKVLGVPHRSIINKQGYACLTIQGNKLLKDIKRKCLKFKLPLLERKWNLININHLNKYERREQRVKQYLAMKRCGATDAEIARELGITKSAISAWKQRGLICLN